MRKPLFFLLFILFFILIATLFFPQIGQFTRIESIQLYHNEWVMFYEENPFMSICIFLSINTLLASLPVPGISMISFIGGSLFGFGLGSLYSSLATAIGNLASFFIARYLLQEWVLSRYKTKVKIFNNDWKTNGVYALLSFRLFPFVPSFVANLIMGVSPLEWKTFFFVSWIGRLPMVLVYAWAGVEFVKIKSASDILSPSVLSSFVALACLPWLFKLLIKNKLKTS